MSEILVDPSKLRPDSNQPRRAFDEDEIKALAESYKAQGVIVPIEVDENNVIILGERRWRAAKRAGVKVPIRRKMGLTLKQRLERQLIDDVHRIELSPQEKVWAFATAVVNINEKANYAINQVKKMNNDVLSATLRIKIGKRFGDEKSGILALSERIAVPERTIATYLSYFKVGSELQKAFDDGNIQLGYLYEVSKLSNLPEEQAKLEKFVLENKFRRRDDIRDYIDEVRRKHGEAIVEAVKEVIPVSTPEVGLETPEELEEAARVLKREAKKKFEAALTPKDKARIEAEKRRRAEERKRRVEEAQQILEEKIKSKVEQEIRAKTTEELLKQPELVKELVKRPEIRQALEETRKVEIPPQKKGYLTLEGSLPVQYQHQREWNLKQLVGRRLNGKEFRFDFVTIGYSQKTLQDLVGLLKLAEARFLIDVRRNPQSMYKPDFNKNNLEKELTAIGIEYVHLPQLGIPRHARNEVYKGSITPRELLEQYETEVLKNNGLSKLLEIVKGNGTFALMCTEVDPTMCHRNKIAQALIEKGMVGYDL